jgi:hypothetical protein
MREDVFQVFLKPDKEDDAPVVLKTTSVRMPSTLLAYIDAMAEKADLSRNAMCVQLLTWGVSFAMAELPDDIRHEIGVSVEGPDYDPLNH